MAVNPADAHHQPQHHHHHHHYHHHHHASTRLKYFAKTLIEPPEVHTHLFDDQVFDHAKWHKHRNSNFRHRIQPVLFIQVALGFGWQLVLVAVVSVLVGLYYRYLVPRGAPAGSESQNVLFTITSFCISLLLVFRTNSSYSRWWEGRVIWGQIVNFARNYTRLVQTWLPADKRYLAPIAERWCIASFHILRAHIREGPTPDQDAQVQRVLLPHEVEYLREWKNKCACAAHVMAWVAHEAGLHPQLQALMQEQVTLYVNMAGGCERIFKTAIPAAYTRHTSRFVMIYVVCTPIFLWPVLGWATPVVATIIGFLLLGTENIGIQIEEPFHVLPLDAICSSLEANVQELARQCTLGFDDLNTLLGAPEKEAWKQMAQEEEQQQHGQGHDHHHHDHHHAYHHDQHHHHHHQQQQQHVRPLTTLSWPSGAPLMPTFPISPPYTNSHHLNDLPPLPPLISSPAQLVTQQPVP